MSELPETASPDGETFDPHGLDQVPSESASAGASTLGRHRELRLGDVGCVTLYEDRAMVKRVLRIDVGPGATTLYVGPVTNFVDDRSVQVAVSGGSGARVNSAKVRRKMVDAIEYASSELGRLDEQRRSALERAEEASERLRRLGAQIYRVESLLTSQTEMLAQLPRGLAESAEDWHEGRRALQERWRSLRDASCEAMLERGKAQLEAERALEKYQRLSGGRSRCETIIEVSMTAEAASRVELDVEYRTPCALWRPEHVATLIAGDNGASDRLRIETYAAIWQRTGEAWNDVIVKLSTARPGRVALPPPLRDDQIYTRRKSKEEQQQIRVEAREQEIQTTGAAGPGQADQMPGVDDGGEPVELTGEAPLTIDSTGEPVRVALGVVELDVDAAVVLYPELSETAFVRARGNFPGPLPLLAGPVRLVRGDVAVGRARLDFVGPGEPIELGIGPHSTTRARRKVETQRDTTMVMGTQLIDRRVEIYLSNLGGEDERVLVTERVPVSEIEGLEVRVGEPGWDIDDDGIATRWVELPPRGHARVVLAYRIKAPSKMVLAF